MGPPAVNRIQRHDEGDARARDGAERHPARAPRLHAQLVPRRRAERGRGGSGPGWSARSWRVAIERGQRRGRGRGERAGSGIGGGVVVREIEGEGAV